MRKTQLVKWLEQKQHEAIKEVNGQYDKKMDEYIAKRNTEMKVDEVAKQVAELISKADDIIDDWRKHISENCGINLYNDRYGSVKYEITGLLTEHDVKKSMNAEFYDESKEFLEISNKRNEVIAEIKKNYTNVIFNVESLKDAKSGVAYLQELGFDLTELLEADKNPVTTALSTQIDTRYLFIK